MRTHIKKEVSSIAHHPAGSVEETRFEKIDNVIFSNSVTASVSVAHEIADLIRKKQQEGKPCVLGLATGSSPVKVYDELVRMHKEEGLSFKNAAAIGDDYNDYKILDAVAWSFKPKDAIKELDVKTKLKHKGGNGAVREMIEMIIKSENLYDEWSKRWL